MGLIIYSYEVQFYEDNNILLLTRQIKIDAIQENESKNSYELLLHTCLNG